jgi:CheY-like chemotaxis protein
MTAPSGHRVLVVEDNPQEREDLCGLLSSVGDSPRAVAAVDEALAAMEEEDFCCFIFDQALPVSGDATPYVTGGERLVRTVRAVDKRFTGGSHVTPILAFTSYSEKAPFMTGLFEIGISTFVSKPLHANMSYFLEKYRGALARAGREDHGKCAALALGRTKGAVEAGAVAAAPVTVAPVTIAIDGRVTTSGNTEIEINGVIREMQDSKLAVILRCIIARERDLAAWTSKEALGIGENRATTTMVRKPFKGLAPEGFQVLEADLRGNFRLNPAVVVKRVDWEALVRHPDATIHRIAVERRKRGSGG